MNVVPMVPVPRGGASRVALVLVFLFAGPVAAQGHEWLGEWGGQGRGPGQMWNPGGVAVDASGRVYVADTGNHRVQVFDRDGALRRLWGGWGTGPGEFKSPASIAIGPDGLVYVGQVLDARVQVFTAEGGYVREFPTLWPADPLATCPAYGLAVAPDGRVFTADLGNGRLQVYGPDGAWLANWDASDANPCFLGQPHKLAFDAERNPGELYVTDHGPQQVLVFDSTGTCVRRWPQLPILPATGLALDGLGRVLVCTPFDVQVFTPTGDLLEQFGSAGTGPGQLDGAVDLAVSRDGDVYVVDEINHRVEHWGPAPVPTRPSSWGRLKSVYR